MAEANRMPRYDVRNDGAGPYAVFYCDACGREFRSTPDVVSTLGQDIGRNAVSGMLRNIPLFGNAIAESVVGQDPRSTYSLTPTQLEKAWGQVRDRFRLCPTCQKIVCLSEWDETSGFCKDDSPRKDQIAQAQGEQAGAMIKGLASAFGISEAVQRAGDAVQRAQTQMARCPQDGTLAAPGTKFCPECGTPMLQPAADTCPNCGKPAAGARFCPECGTKIERAVQKPAVCPQCGASVQGAKFCPECGTKI